MRQNVVINSITLLIQAGGRWESAHGRLGCMHQTASRELIMMLDTERTRVHHGGIYKEVIFAYQNSLNIPLMLHPIDF
jgi:hypothetical protein